MTKPGWMQEIEDKQAAMLIASDRADELAASNKAILSSEAHAVWTAVKEKIAAISEMELRGVRFSITDDGASTIAVFIVPDGQPNAQEIIRIVFEPQHYKFVRFDNHIRPALTLYLGVSGGRLALLDEWGDEIPCDVQGIADAVSQRFLEPLLREWAAV